MQQRLPAALPAVFFWLLLLAAPAFARESCPFLRDPAFYARAPVPAAAAGELAVGTLNLHRLFDDEQDAKEREVRTKAQLAAKVARQARYIANDMRAPAILAVQEIEDDTAARALREALRRETGRDYDIVMGDKAASETIRSALFVDSRYPVTRSHSLFARAAYARGPQHDRLPLVAEVDAGSAGRYTVVAVHLKSMIGIDAKNPDEAARVRDKRRLQATELAAWVRDAQARGSRLLVLGDFNAPVTDNADVRGEPLRLLLAPGVLADPGPRFLAPGQRWTYRHGCLLQQLDHVFVSPALLPRVAGYAIARGDTCLRAKEKCDAATSISDHEGVVLRLRPASAP